LDVKTEDAFLLFLSVLGSMALTLLLVLLALGVGAVGITVAVYAENALDVDLAISGKQINIIGSTLTGGIYGAIGLLAGGLSGWWITRKRRGEKTVDKTTQP
jgi:hypothetical protein